MYNQNRKATIVKILFCLYVIVLGYFLFFSEHYGRGIVSSEYRYNLVLFQEINRFIKHRNIIGVEGFVVNIIGNVFAFVPFGILAPLMTKKPKFFNILLMCFEFTLLIELTQLITKVGIFDVDDLVMNTIGGMIGYVMYGIGNGIYKRRRR